MEPDERVAQIKQWLGSGSINIFGLPFAGKDTHGRELARLFGGPLIGGGDILRSAADPELKKHIATGKLAPTDEYLSLVLPYFAQDKFKNQPLVLSAVGRWFGEHLPVRQAAKDSSHELKAAIFIIIGQKEVHKRWQASRQLQDRGQRHDDAEHLLEKRIQEFEAKTLPVIDYYRHEGLLIEVDGNPARQAVTSEIINQLYKLSRA